ncbi:MAG: Ldh family oxidoreductase [Candidatus Hadarchaeales archaeon]
MIVTHEQEKRLIYALLSKLDVDPEQAEVTADVLTEGDLRGFSSHGIMRLPYILRAIKRGTIIGRANVKIAREKGATALVDGGHGLGHYIAKKAMEIAIEKAKKFGIGAVGVMNSNHFGIAGYYAEMAVKEEMIGIVTTTTDALVHPWGGVEPILGTNALAIGIPAEPIPIIVDMAMSNAARGKIVQALKEGREIPLGWAIDEEGNPTTDPAKAIKGALSPFGGVKGYALALALEILAGPLVGAEAGKKVRGTLEPVEDFCTKGDLMIAIDPTTFVPKDEFKRKVGEFIEEIKSSKKAKGAEEILLPGEPELRTREKRLRDGIPISEEVWKEIETWAKELNVDLEEILRQ